MSRQALEMALEALERSVATCFDQRSHDAVMGRPEHFVNQAITAINEALAQPEQETCKGCNGNGMVGNILDTVLCPFCKGTGIEAQPEQEPDWKGLVLSHNADCESRCDMERCKYAPYFKANGRRCPTCPVYEIIDVDYTTPQRTWFGLTDDDWDNIFGDAMTIGEAIKVTEAKLKEKNT